jgi:hypothetical protein
MSNNEYEQNPKPRRCKAKFKDFNVCNNPSIVEDKTTGSPEEAKV